MPIFLIKYLPQIIFVVVVITALGFAGYNIHNNGRQVERAEWLDKEASRKEQELVLVTAARKAVQAEADRQRTGLMEVINAQAELTNKLNNDIANLDGKRMFVSAKPAKCDSGGVPTKTDDPSEFSSGTRRVELSEAFAREIRDDYFTAQRVANQYEACRQALMNIAVIVE